MGGFGIVGILKESGRIIASNPRHFLLLTLTFVIPLSFIMLAPSFLIIQPLPDTSSPLVTPPPVDRRIIIYISLILIFQIPLTALVTAIIIYSAYLAYLAMPHTARLTIDDEEEEDEVPKTVVIMSSIGDQEKGIRVQEEEEDLTLTLAHAFASLRFTLPRLLLTVLTLTGLYLLISVALTLLGGITLFIMISALGNDGPYYALGITFLLLMPIFCCVFVHLYLRWSLSVIVATLEANTYGWQALKRSDSLSKGNHRLLFSFLVIHVVVTISLYFVQDHSSPSLFSLSYIKNARTILFIILSSFYHLYYLVVMTMIYVSCKLYHGEPLIYLSQYAKIPENDINKIY